jgi:60 kDa SS-A/Ro ribonucleoprotein
MPLETASLSGGDMSKFSKVIGKLKTTLFRRGRKRTTAALPAGSENTAAATQALVLTGPDRFNRAGGLAYGDSPQMALYRQVATSLWSGDGYYERQADWFKRFQSNVAAALAADARFPFALAAFARDKRGLALRTSPVALYVEAVAHPLSKGTGYARRYAPAVLRRADEPAEAIAYFRLHHSGVVPHGLLRGIQSVVRGFDEYQLAKYKEPGAVSMRDVMRLARPKPKDAAEEALWKKVVKRELETPYTWETELSGCKTEAEKQAKWNELIVSGRLGLFALVRNLRNIVQAGADVEEALSQLTPERVQESGILPFQWYKAYKAVAAGAGSALAEPLQQALVWSLAGVRRLPGVTLVACDNSGSMSHGRVTHGMTNAEIGNLMGAMALQVCETGTAGTFGSQFALAEVNPRHDVFYNKRQIDACGKTTGQSTDAWRIFEYLIRSDLHVDRVVLFSDMQCYDSGARRWQGSWVYHSLAGELDTYLKTHPGSVVYSVNLAAQDNSCQFAPDQPVVELAGWSESIFEFITALEAGQSIIEHINNNY